MAQLLAHGKSLLAQSWFLILGLTALNTTSFGSEVRKCYAYEYDEGLCFKNILYNKHSENRTKNIADEKQRELNKVTNLKEPQNGSLSLKQCG